MRDVPEDATLAAAGDRWSTHPGPQVAHLPLETSMLNPFRSTPSDDYAEPVKNSISRLRRRQICSLPVRWWVLACLHEVISLAVLVDTDNAHAALLLLLDCRGGRKGVGIGQLAHLHAVIDLRMGAWRQVIDDQVIAGKMLLSGPSTPPRAMSARLGFGVPFSPLRCPVPPFAVVR